MANMKFMSTRLDRVLKMLTNRASTGCDKFYGEETLTLNTRTSNSKTGKSKNKVRN